MSNDILNTLIVKPFSIIGSIYYRLYINFLWLKYNNIAQFTRSTKFGKYSKLYNTTGDINKIIIGDNTLIDGILQIFPFGNELSIGENCYIGENTRIWCADRIVIGNDVLISHNVNIMDTDSHEINFKERMTSTRKQFREGLPRTKGSVKTAPVTIGDNAWISYNASILKGVTIGRGAIIGCGSVVTHDIPDMCLAVGNPAKVIKRLNVNDA